MSIGAVMDRARALAVRTLTDQCVIYAVGEPVLNEDTGKLEPAVAEIWRGPCRVKIDNAALLAVSPGEQEAVRARPILQIPASADAAIPVGSRVDVESRSPGVSSARYVVIGERAASSAPLRRFEAEAVERG